MLVLVNACGWKTCAWEKSPISLHQSLCLLSVPLIEKLIFIDAGIIGRRHLMAIGQVLYFRTGEPRGVDNHVA